MLTDEADRATRGLERELTRRQCGVDHCHHRIVPPQWDQHIADRETSAPDRVNHGMVGACGRVGTCDLWIGAEMPRQFERELHARGIFRKTLVDAELEEERPALM